jgi:hypothetical protein
VGGGGDGRDKGERKRQELPRNVKRAEAGSYKLELYRDDDDDVRS